MLKLPPTLCVLASSREILISCKQSFAFIFFYSRAIGASPLVLGPLSTQIRSPRMTGIPANQKNRCKDAALPRRPVGNRFFL